METPTPEAENKFEFVETPAPEGTEVTVVLVSGKKLGIKVQKDYPIQLSKVAIQNELGIPIDQQRLIFDGKEVVGSLEDHGIQEGSILQLVVIAKDSEARCYGQSETSDCAFE